MTETQPKINIVLLTDCLADLAGGAEKQIFELAKGLDKRRYNVFVVSLDCWGQAPRDLIESAGSQLHIFRVVRIYGISGLKQGIRFFNFLRQHQIKIILTYHFSSDMWGTFWGHFAGVPVILSNRRDMGFWRNSWHVRAYKLMNRWVQKIIVVSHAIKQMVIETESVPSDRIDVIYNGVDLPQKFNHFTDIKRGDLGLKEKDVVIMHVANLKPVKGHRFLIEAFAPLVGQFPQAKLVLIGKDELNSQIQQMATRLNIQNNVLFLGKREDISQLLPLADICVLPSLSEGMSNAVLEYMAAAKPVIATKVGGNPELIKEGFNGLLVEKENVQQLTEALLTLLGDPGKRQAMGQNGFLKVVSDYSMKTMMSCYDRLFTELAPGKKIKVLHLVSSGGLFGAERVILNLTARCKELDCIVGAVYNHHSPHLEMISEAKRLGLKNIYFESCGRFDFQTIKAIEDYLLCNSIDILHTHNYKADIVGFWATRRTRVKWMATNHLWHSTDKKLQFYEFLDAFVLRFAQKVVSVSLEIKNDLLRKGFNENRLQVIDNGIPVDVFNDVFPREQTRQALGVQAKDCAVVIVGRLAIEKGHEIFLLAASKVIAKADNVKFIVVGDGPLAESLKQRTKELQLSDHVLFTGIRQDMPAIYASCDILVNASFMEGLPMTILEAMASHLPVIATSAGGVGDVIKNQDNGILLEPGKPDEMAEAILELVEDEQKRKRYAQKAYQDVCDRFCDTRMAAQYQQIYREILYLLGK